MANIILAETIEQRIFVIRSHRVMIDRHLAGLYGVTTMALNQAVKRNGERFPANAERDEVITICDNLRPLKFSPVLPNAFTENGVAMLSSVLRSKRAIQVNIQVMRTFTKLRQLISTHKELARKIEDLERGMQSHDHKIEIIFEAIRELMNRPRRTRKVVGFQPR